MRRRLLVAFAAAFLARSAAAQETPPRDDLHECIDANADGQHLQKAGKLIAATARFAACAREACPVEVRANCAELLARVQDSTPTIVVDACDRAGDDTTVVAMSIDGVGRASALDGRAMTMDPGEHVLRFELPGAPAIEQRIVVVEGQKNRIVTADFTGEGARHRCHQPAPPLPAPTHRTVPPATWVLGAVAVAAVGAFAYFGISGLVALNNLDQCKPGCAPSDYDDMALRYYLADGSLALAATSLATAIVVYFARPAHALNRAATSPLVLRF